MNDRGSRRRWLAPGAAFLLLSLAGDARGEHARAGETRWYGAEPHVPLAVVSRGAVAEAGPTSCRAWSRVGRDWTAVDRWGQSLGARRLVGRELYDVTGCYEVTFPDDPREAVRPWRPTEAVLYARGAWRPRASVEWRPASSVREEHARFVDALSRALRPPENGHTGTPPLSSGELTMFFQVAPEGDTDVHAASRKRQLAASGGRVLVIAERNPDGTWFAHHVENALALERTSNEQAYRPIAVFDMNGDGWPEVIVHEREGDGEFFGDIVVSRDGSGTWSVVARSPGGSTA